MTRWLIWIALWGALGILLGWAVLCGLEWLLDWAWSAR